MKTLLICHQGANISQYAISRWLASFSDLVGIIVVEEKRERVYKRIRREIVRVGFIRFLDVIAFRIYYKVFLARKDRIWEQGTLQALAVAYPKVRADTPILKTHSPNSSESKAFIAERNPDLVIARCKAMLEKSVFSLPAMGTFVMHPGICPEYRNAHGCFWALASNDPSHVGMTLLKIDGGVDTGPIYGYYTYAFNEINESHVVIQSRVVLENLEEMRKKLLDIYAGTANPVETAGRESRTWGQPWLTAYLRWKYLARKRHG